MEGEAMGGAGAPAGRSYDLGLIRDQYERQRQDAEMITGLCTTIFNLTKENQDLKARIAAMAAPNPPNP